MATDHGSTVQHVHATTTPTQAERPFFRGLVKYMGSGPVVAMVWEGMVSEMELARLGRRHITTVPLRPRKNLLITLD